jgi:hypothetical protein
LRIPFGEAAGEVEVGRPGLAPDHVGILGIGEAARERLVESLSRAVEALGVRSPVRNGRSRSSTSEVTMSAASASVRASRTVGTPSTSAASRAAASFCTCSWVGTSTLPPMCPHFFTDASWSSKCTPAAPCIDHRLHQLERVQHAAEPGFRVGDDRREVVRLAVPSIHWIWSARASALLMRRTTVGTDDTA